MSLARPGIHSILGKVISRRSGSLPSVAHERRGRGHFGRCGRRHMNGTLKVRDARLRWPPPRASKARHQHFDTSCFALAGLSPPRSRIYPTRCSFSCFSGLKLDGMARAASNMPPLMLYYSTEGDGVGAHGRLDLYHHHTRWAVHCAALDHGARCGTALRRAGRVHPRALRSALPIFGLPLTVGMLEQNHVPPCCACGSGAHVMDGGVRCTYIV